MTKKTFFGSSFVLFAAGLTMTAASCTNEDENSVKPDEKGLIPVEIRSGISGGRTALDGDGKTVKFQSGDKLAVWDADKHEFTTTGSSSMAVFKGTLNASTPTGQTLSILYPYSAGQGCATDGTITATIPAKQTATAGTFDPKANLSVATADYTKGQNVTCTLQNVCGLLKFKIEEVEGYDEYDYVEISDAAETKQNIAGTVTINPAADTPQATDGNKTVITLKAGSGQTLKADGSTVYYVVLKPGTFADGIEMKFYNDEKDKYGTATLTKTGGGTLSINPGVILNAGVVTPVMKKAPPKPIGNFTVYVSPDKKDTTKVSFAPGNLYCKKDGDNWTWGFYDEQWKYNSLSMGKSSRTASTDDTEIDLFCWGYDEAGSTNPVEKTSRSSFTDWGASIDGSKWLTLTRAEWDYLINTRTMPSSKPRWTNRSDGILIGGTTYNGLFIYPDGYSGNEVGTTGGPDTWTDINSAGIVFLPCAGYRNGSKVSSVGSYGFYWSSSPHTSSASYAYLVNFYSGSVNPQYGYGRNYGFTVRLVCVSE